MTDLDYQLIWRAQISFLAVTLAFALWRGDRTVRLVALLFLAGQATMLAADRFLPSLSLVDAGVEMIALVVLVAMALHTPAPWLRWLCAFQLATVASYVAAALDPRIRTLAFITATNAWWMLEQAALLWGALAAHRRRLSAATPA